MKIYSTPSVSTMNVEIENTILAGSPYTGQMEGNFPIFYRNDGNGGMQYFQLIDGKYYQWNPDTQQPNISAGGLDQLPWADL